jgi:S-disulfanyl-L-cysteine oxidoreductase SoxD
MRKSRLIAGALITCVLLSGIAVYALLHQRPVAFIDRSDQGRVARGKEIFASHCAACHGARLEGQPDWRQRLPDGRLPAPPHDASGHTWHHPDGILFDIVKNGLVPGKTAPEGYQSNMPAYRDILPDPDIIAVLAYIKSTWPADIARLQEEVTEQAQ